MRNAITLNRSWRTKMMEVFSAPFCKLNAFLLSLGSAFMLTTPTLCTLNTNLDEDKLFGGLADIIIWIAYRVGALMLIGGVFAYIMAHREEDSRGQANAIRIVVISLLLIGFEGMLKIVGILK